MLIALLALVAATLFLDRTFYRDLPVPNTQSSSVIDPLLSGLPLTNVSAFDDPSLVIRALVFDPTNIASDEAWATYIHKGQYYQCLLESTDRLAGMGLRDTRTPPSAESAWQGDMVNELATWGWNDAEYSNAIHCDFRNDIRVLNKNKIESMFTDMHLDPQPVPFGPNVCHSVEHNEEPASVIDDDESDRSSVFDVPIAEQRYTIGNQRFTQTGGHYRFGINRRGGAIFAQFLKKPSVAAAENWGRTPGQHELPQLHHASDIIWAYWIRDNPSPDELQYYVVNHVQNAETLPLIARVAREKGRQQLPFWTTRIILKSGEHAFNAILGSPMGSTIAHLLLQHKAVLGVKHIMQIFIFRDNRQPGSVPQPQILFWIGDVDPEEIHNDDDEEMPDAVGKRDVAVQILDEEGTNVVRVHKIIATIDDE